jgi:hypothetical protein
LPKHSRTSTPASGLGLGVDLRRRYVKVYEFQARGVIHYHALIRLDGRTWRIGIATLSCRISHL